MLSCPKYLAIADAVSVCGFSRERGMSLKDDVDDEAEDDGGGGGGDDGKGKEEGATPGGSVV